MKKCLLMFVVMSFCIYATAAWAQEDFTSGEMISVQGKLLTLDGAEPHVAVPVQAIRNGKVAATTLSDADGKYQLVNLKPGMYQVRCQVLGGYVYYGEEEARKA